jgi:hypothetical protein
MLHYKLHRHTYLNTDCGIEINNKLYSDSIVRKKVHYGRTNAKSISDNILAPKSTELCNEAMKAGTQNTVPFPLASEIKLFPIAVK